MLLPQAAATITTILFSKEPAWHRRQRAQRSAARTLLRVQSARDLLSLHHSAQNGATVPQPIGAAKGTKPQPGPPTTGCSRPTCKGTIPTGTLVHKLSIGQAPCCRVCAACGQHKRYFRLPPGSDTNPLHYPRPGTKSAPAHKQPFKAPSNYAQAARAALEAENKLLREHLANQGLPVPVQEQDENLDDLKAALELLQKLGEPTANVEAKIAEAEAAAIQSNKATPDLKAVEGKLKAATAHAKQVADNVLKLQEQLAAAHEKSVQAELTVNSLLEEKDTLLAAQDYVHKENATIFPKAPGNATEEQTKSFAAGVEEIKKALEVQVSLLFQKTFPSSPSQATRAEEEAPAVEGKEKDKPTEEPTNGNSGETHLPMETETQALALGNQAAEEQAVIDEKKAAAKEASKHRLEQQREESAKKKAMLSNEAAS